MQLRRRAAGQYQRKIDRRAFDAQRAGAPAVDAYLADCLPIEQRTHRGRHWRRFVALRVVAERVQAEQVLLCVRPVRALTTTSHHFARQRTRQRFEPLAITRYGSGRDQTGQRRALGAHRARVQGRVTGTSGLIERDPTGAQMGMPQHRIERGARERTVALQCNRRTQKVDLAEQIHLRQMRRVAVQVLNIQCAALGERRERERAHGRRHATVVNTRRDVLAQQLAQVAVQTLLDRLRNVLTALRKPTKSKRSVGTQVGADPLILRHPVTHATIGRLKARRIGEGGARQARGRLPAQIGVEIFTQALIVRSHRALGQALLPARIGIVAHVAERPIQVAQNAPGKINLQHAAARANRLANADRDVHRLCLDTAVQREHLRHPRFAHAQRVAHLIAIERVTGNRQKTDLAGRDRAYIEPFAHAFKGLDLDLPRDAQRRGERAARRADRHRQFTHAVAAIEHTEARLHSVARAQLVRHQRTQFGWRVDREAAFAQPHRGTGGGRDCEHAPSGQVVGHGKASLGAPLRIHRYRRIPVRHVTKQITHRKRRCTAVATAVRALALKLLASHQLVEQRKTHHVQFIQAMQAGVRVVAPPPALQKIQHRLVQHHQCNFAGGMMAVTAGLQLDRHLNLLARFVLRTRSADRERQARGLTHHRHPQVTHAHRRLAQIHLPALRQRCGDPRREHGHAKIESGRIGRLDRQLNHRCAAVELLHEAAQDAVTLHADQRLRTRVRILDQEARPLADCVFGLVRHDVECALVAAAP